MTTIVGPLDIKERKAVTLFFSEELPAGVNLLSIAIEVTTVPDGKDLTPSNLVDGAAVIVNNDGLIFLNGANRVPNVKYHIRAIGTDESGGITTISLECTVARF